MIDTQKIRHFLAQRNGGGPWLVFESNVFGWADREDRVHQVGRMEIPQDTDPLVELLNGASELLRDYDDLVVTRNGIGVRRSVQSLVSEIASLRTALTEALTHWPDLDETRRAELRKLT